MPIKTLGKYELIEELGRGGFGTVYRARDTTLDVERAVKVLHPALAASPEFIERFRREGRFAARLEHTHIVPVYELGEADGSYYLAMKYLPGGSLKDLLARQGPLSFVEAVEIIRQVAEALTYAYQQPEKLIHRDLKPGNILFESLPGGKTKVAVRLSDFGFAKALAEAGTSTSSASGGMLGTPAYMAPEVWRGKTASPAADQYALACVLYEMLTGQTLFTGDSPPEVMTKHVLDGPQFPANWPQGVASNIEAVLRRALAIKPEERYPDVAAFSAACANLLAPPVVVPVTPEPEETPAPLIEKTQPAPPIEVPPTKNRRVETRRPTQRSAPPREVEALPAQPQTDSKAIGWMWAIAVGLLIITFVVIASNGGFRSGGIPATAVPTEPEIVATATNVHLPTWTGAVQKTVEAKNGWVDTGILVTEGQEWAITYVSGRWSPCVPPYGCPYVDAVGDPTMGGSEDASLNSVDNIIQGCYHAALIASIGSNAPFCVGNRYSGVAQQTGILGLSINDGNLVDDGGSISVQIEVGTVVSQAVPTSAPPVAATDGSATPTLTPYPLAVVPNGKIGIRWFIGLGTGTDADQLPVEQSVVDDFNADPARATDNIFLVMEVVPNASARDTVLTEIAAGSGPDVIGPVGWNGSAALHGQWLDLRNYIARIPNVTQDFDPALLASYNSDEGQIGLPFAVFPSAIFFSTALFDEAGLAYPPARYGDKYMLDGKMVDWDWQTTVKEVAQRLTVSDNGHNATENGFDKTKIVQYGFTWNFEGQPSYLGTFWANGSFTDASGRRAQIPDAWLNSWKWFYDGVWGAQPFIPNSAVQNSPDFGNGNVFNSRKIAMTDQPIWYTCCLGDVKDWDLGAMPSYKGRVNGRVDADTFRIWKSTQHPDEAFTVLTYLVTTGVQKLIIGSPDMSAAYGSVPARAKDFASWRTAKQAAFPWVKNWDLILAGLSYPDSPSAEAYMPNYNDAWTATGAAYSKWLSTDGLDINAEADQLQKDLQAIFDK